MLIMFLQSKHKIGGFLLAQGVWKKLHHLRIAIYGIECFQIFFSPRSKTQSCRSKQIRWFHFQYRYSLIK